MNEYFGHELRVWEFARAPESLQRLAAGASEWVAFIPAPLVTPEVEALFLRWESDQHPVIRRRLANGSVLLAGSYPSATTMTGSIDAQIPDLQRPFSGSQPKSSRAGRS
jgi:hypothetical protein